MVMSIYEKNLEMIKAAQYHKDKELAQELKSRKLTPNEQKAADDAMGDLLQMELDDLKKLNDRLDASIATSRSRSSGSSSYRPTTSVQSHYDRLQSGKGRKEGRAISASNAAKIQSHLNTVDEHVKALQSSADDLATVLQGSEGAYGSDYGTPADGQQEGKSRYVGSRYAYQVKANDPGTVQRSTPYQTKGFGQFEREREEDCLEFAAQCEKKLRYW